MCGIAGFVAARGAAPPDSSGLRAAVHALAHRGPDQEGIHESPTVALGFTRLSIIDLEGGAQPMTNEDGSVVVVYNGEIWNYVDLRDRLVARGHRFATRSDTEVLVHGYEEWGDDVVDRLDGMFAFAIWDERRERLLLARDRFGKKPLYFGRTDSGIAFGSDARSIFLASGRKPEIALDRVAEYLFQRYVISPATLFAGIERLPPAHRATFDRERLEVSRYWYLEVPDEPAPLTANELRELLAVATARRLMSDVPLGLLLSGGVDSTAILALARDAGATDLATFTVGFDDPVYDERERARRAAAHFGTEHHELEVRRSEFLDAWQRLAWYRDEPVAEASEIPLFLLSEFAGRHVRVVLSGDGGDEVFGGYPKYRADALLRAGGRPAALALRAVLGIMNLRPTHRQLGRAAGTLGMRDPLIRWASWFRTMDAGTVSGILAPEIPASIPDGLASRLGDLLQKYDTIDAGRRMLLGDLFTYLPDNMLLRSDKVLMAGSLEGRMPLLDVEVARRATSASAGSRSALLQGKKILVDAMAGLVPSELRGGSKRGFPVPVEQLLLGEGREFVDQLLLSERCLSRGLFRPEVMRQAVRGDAGKLLPPRGKFVLASLELWARANVDNVSSSPPAGALELAAAPGTGKAERASAAPLS